MHRYRPRGAPDAKLPVKIRDTKVNPWPLDCRRHARQHGGVERQRTLEDERMFGIAWREERERDLGHVGFLAPQARPERRVDHRLDRGDVGNRLDRDATGPAIEMLM